MLNVHNGASRNLCSFSSVGLHLRWLSSAFLVIKGILANRGVIIVVGFPELVRINYQTTHQEKSDMTSLNYSRIHGNAATTPFLPNLDEWARMYNKWSDRMAKSLWPFGNTEECREVVHEAFLKAMGLSDHLHLRDELTPKAEGCWYGFLRNQAKGILSNRHRYADRFEPIKEYGLAEETLDEDDWGDVDDSDALVAYPTVYCRDTDWLKGEVRKTIKDVCREAGVTERNIRAFELFVLDDEDGRIVVGAIPSVKNANNLYQIKNRIMNLLMASDNRFAGIFDKLIAA